MIEAVAPRQDTGGHAKQAAPNGHRGGFRLLLSELNPLQYVPVLGTIYRAVTGDCIPENARIAGSLVVSGLTGGPVGVAIGLAETAVEKLTGIDPERLGTRVLAAMGIGHAAARAPAPPGALLAGPAPPGASLAGPAPPGASSAAPTPPGGPAATPVLAAAREVAWSPAQLAAYRVTTSAGGSLRQGGLQDSDVLNSLELGRLAALA